MPAGIFYRLNKYGKEHGGYPSLEAIKKGVSNYMGKRTVDRIISDIDLLAACKNHPSKLKLREFVNSMCQHGLDGNIPAGKLWLALVFGWNEKKMVEILNNVTLKPKLSIQDLRDSYEKIKKAEGVKLKGVG